MRKNFSKASYGIMTGRNFNETLNLVIKIDLYNLNKFNSYVIYNSVDNLIHCLDPVFICEKIAYASIDKVVDIKTLLASTITGFEGIGGVQTRGKYREGYPEYFYK